MSKIKLNQQTLDDLKKDMPEIERYRKNKLKELKISAICLLICGGYLGYYGFSVLNENASLALIIWLGLIVSSYYILKRPLLNYNSVYKSKVIPSLLRSLPGNFKYRVTGFIKLNEISKFSLMSKCIYSVNSQEGEDLFVGKVDDVEIKFSEVKYKKVKFSEFRKKKTTQYQGLVVLLTFPFKFESHNIISTKLKNTKSLNLDLKKARVDDHTFSELYSVFTNNNADVSKILTPAALTRIIALTEKGYLLDKYKNLNIEIEFLNNQVLIKLSSSEDMFEPLDLSISAYDKKSLAVIIKQVGILVNLAKQLKLDYTK